MTALSPPVTAEQVLKLLVRRISVVMAVEETQVDAAARLDEDLHADSLDLVEILEGVETDLRTRGITVALPDTVFAALHTVGDAAERIAAHAAPPATKNSTVQTPFSAQSEDRV